jgi:hypothetical protein
LGNPGDFYIDLTVAREYGPKTVSWSAAESAFAGATPGAIAAGAYELGNQFKFVVAGRITALSFYRVSGSTVTSRVARIWDTNGNLLATSAASSEGGAGAGWISVALTTPYSISANQQIIVSYSDPAYQAYNTNLNSATSDIVIVEGRWGNTLGSFPSGIDTSDSYSADVSFEKSAGSSWPVAIPSLIGPAGPAGPPGTSAATKMIWGEDPSGTIDGVNTSFASANPYSPNLIAVFLNGLRQRRTADYTETGSQSFQFVNAPLPGDSLSIDYIQP